MQSIVVFSRGSGSSKEGMNASELSAEAERDAAEKVAKQLGGILRETINGLAIDGLNDLDDNKITSVCRHHKLNWMRNKHMFNNTPVV